MSQPQSKALTDALSRTSRIGPDAPVGSTRHCLFQACDVIFENLGAAGGAGVRA